MFSELEDETQLQHNNEEATMTVAVALARADGQVDVWTTSIGGTLVSQPKGKSEVKVEYVMMHYYYYYYCDDVVVLVVAAAIVDF